jgi:hypothetical protein
LAKGMQIFIEALIIMSLMFSLLLKANLFSLVFLVFIYKFAGSTSKTELLVRVNTYQSILFLVSYFLFLMNLTSHTSPQEFPDGFKGFPMHKVNKSATDYDKAMNIEYIFPLFFHYDMFKDLKLAYMLGIGIDRD